MLFRSILAVLLSFFLFKFLYKKDLRIAVPKWKNYRTYLPFLVLLTFMLTLILATLFSEDIMFSIFGWPNRAGGILNLLFFFVFTVFLALFINENNWKKLFNFLFITGILASLLAVVQYFNILKNVFISYESGGTPSFLGNSTFLAIYMLFLSMLSLTHFAGETEKKKKMLYGALFLLFVFTILITGARATYLGLLAGLFFFFFFYPRTKRSSGAGVNPKKFKALKIIAASLVLLVIVIVVFFNLFPQLAEKNNLLKIAADRLSVKKITTDLAGTRFSAWKITLQAIKDKPIFGWGPENFYIGFEKYYDPTISNIKNLWWDRPHNVFLDVAVSSGIISLVFYLLFWTVLLWQLQKLKNTEQRETEHETARKLMAHGLQAMFIGYLAALFFNFDSFSTSLISFFFVGYAFYLISIQAEKIIIYPPKNKIFQKKPVFIGFLLILFLFLWFWNIKPLYLNENIVYADNLVNVKKCEKALNIMDGTWQSAGTLKAYAGLKYADFIKKCATAEKEVEYVLMGSKALKEGSVVQPKFTRTWMFLGSFTNILAAREKNPETQKNLLAEAIRYLEKALNLSPKRQEILIEMEKSYIMAKDYQAMKKIAYECVKIDSSYGLCYWYLGVAEIFLGEQTNGKKHIEEALEKSSTSPPYIQLGVAYISQKNYKDAAEAYYMATVYNDDKNANYRAVLAFLYKEIGEYDKARKEAVKVFELQPENKEALEFLKQLLGLGSNDLNVHTSLAYIYNQLGEKEKFRQELLIVKSLYLQLIAKHPKSPDFYINLAKVYKELGEYENARQAAQLAEKLDPENFLVKAREIIQSLPLPITDDR